MAEESGPRKEKDLDTKNGPIPLGKGTILGGVKQLMTCPYNESHRVGFGSFALHLLKCRRQLSPEQLKWYTICEYNATHHMLTTVYQDHLTICEDHNMWQAEHADMPEGFFSKRTHIDYFQDDSERERAEDFSYKYYGEDTISVMTSGATDDATYGTALADLEADFPCDERFSASSQEYECASSTSRSRASSVSNGSSSHISLE